MGRRISALSILAVLAAGALVPATAAADGARLHASGHHAKILRVGMHGRAVRKLQSLLRRRGFRVRVDGAFGRRTRRAVKRAQRAYGLTVDGVAGPITMHALRHGPPPPSAGQSGGAAPGDPDSSGSAPCSSKPGDGDRVARWRPVVRCVLGMLGRSQSSGTIDNVLIVIRYESGGDPNAENDWDSNAKAGDSSRGLMQTIGATFRSYRSSELPNDIFDPAANIYAGLNYGIHRYGSIASIPGVKSVNAGGGYRPYKQIAP